MISNVTRNLTSSMDQVYVSKPLAAPTAATSTGDDINARERGGRKVFSSAAGLNAREKKVICVTSGSSALGSSIARRLIAGGYLVRLTLQHQGDVEDLKEKMEERILSELESVVVVKMEDQQSLCDAFRGCHAIFHTSSLIDPHGVSGYNEQMAFLETVAARNVIEACAEAAYVKRCVFTSSLLASIWQADGADTDRRIDESCWSDMEFCRTNKLWLALGKTRAESIAWIKSRELKVNLVTVCPGLLQPPLSCPNSYTQTCVPYLKGAHMMLQKGVLATVDMDKVAEAHVRVYEAMNHGASGRYHCFDRVITKPNEAIELGKRVMRVEGPFPEEEEEFCSRVSNSKLKRLLLQASQRLSCEE